MALCSMRMVQDHRRGECTLDPDLGINPQGDMVGNYADRNNRIHGFPDPKNNVD